MPSFRGQIADRQLLLAVQVSRPSLDSGQEIEPASFRALLDTGATISAVSQEVIDSLRLVPDGWRAVAGVHGTIDTPTYTVRLQIPITERIAVPDGEKRYRFSRYRDPMEVMLLRLRPESFDVLLGMDVLEAFHLTIHGDQFILSI